MCRVKAPRLPLVAPCRHGLLVQELGLRDAAVFDGWVVPPPRPDAAPELAESAAADGREGAPSEDAPPVTALPSIRHRTYPRGRAVLTEADMEKAARLHEDRDASFDTQGEILPDGTEVGSGFRTLGFGTGKVTRRLDVTVWCSTALRICSLAMPRFYLQPVTVACMIARWCHHAWVFGMH